MSDIKIYGKLRNETTDGILAGTDQIKDENLGKFQSDINKDLRDGKQDNLVNGKTIKTINGEEILGSGNIKTVGKVDTTPGATEHGEVFNSPINRATGLDSHASGTGIVAENMSQHSIGRFNALESIPSPNKPSDEKTIFSIGGGKSENTRKDLIKTIGSGKTWISGIGGFDGTNSETSESLQEYTLDTVRAVPTTGPITDVAEYDNFSGRLEDVKNDLRVVAGTKITPEMLAQSTKDYIESTGGGIITNQPDDEDLTSINGVLKFKDKKYNESLYSGLGKVYLRKNIIDVDGTLKNVLTKEMVSQANTIYVIKYDYDLNGAGADGKEPITIPNNCTLQFEGGSLKNGTIIGNETVIRSSLYNILDVDLQGTFKELNKPEYIGYREGKDLAVYCNNLYKVSNNIKLTQNQYSIKSELLVVGNFDAPNSTLNVYQGGKIKIGDNRQYGLEGVVCNFYNITAKDKNIPIGLHIYNLNSSVINLVAISEFKNNIYIEGNGNGVAYNTFNFGFCYHSSDTLMKAESKNDGWINQNYYNNIRFANGGFPEGKAIKFIKGLNKYSFDSNIFTNISFEFNGVRKEGGKYIPVADSVCDLEGFTFGKFLNIRNDTNTNIIFKFKNKSVNNIITSEYGDTPIDDSENIDLVGRVYCYGIKESPFNICKNTIYSSGILKNNINLYNSVGYFHNLNIYDYNNHIYRGIQLHFEDNNAIVIDNESTIGLGVIVHTNSCRTFGIKRSFNESIQIKYLTKKDGTLIGNDEEQRLLGKPTGVNSAQYYDFSEATHRWYLEREGYEGIKYFEFSIPEDIGSFLLCLCAIGLDKKFRSIVITAEKADAYTSYTKINRIGNDIPSTSFIGDFYYDVKTKQPLWYDGDKFKNANGITPNIPTSGPTSERPTTLVGDGFKYWDTDLKQYVVKVGYNWKTLAYMPTHFDGVVSDVGAIQGGLSENVQEILRFYCKDTNRFVYAKKGFATVNNYYQTSSVDKDYNLTEGIRKDIIFEFDGRLYTYNEKVKGLAFLDGEFIDMPSHSTTRPDASKYPLGVPFYDESKGYVVFSNGTDWIKADGTIDN